MGSYIGIVCSNKNCSEVQKKLDGEMSFNIPKEYCLEVEHLFSNFIKVNLGRTNINKERIWWTQRVLWILAEYIFALLYISKYFPQKKTLMNLTLISAFQTSSYFQSLLSHDISRFPIFKKSHRKYSFLPYRLKTINKKFLVKKAWLCIIKKQPIN